MNHNHYEQTCCCKSGQKVDYLFWITLGAVMSGYVFHLLNFNFNITPLTTYNTAIFETVNKMWWGVILGIFFVGALELVPTNVINKMLGSDGGFKGIVRAAVAGVLFDLCSHGILLVSMKLYRKGLSLPQMLAFLIASPWNSISLTIILFALIGFKWTALFMILSLAVAIVSGMIFQFLTDKNILPKNPHVREEITDLGYKESFAEHFKDKEINFSFFFKLAKDSVKESEMILRWVFLGVVIAALVRAFVPDVMFAHYFGASMLGIFMTLIATTIIEVCSEGSVPIAADILHRAMAPGNAFVFLMAGVATDYTEIMVLREVTKSWRVAFFLPLVTVPQIVLLGYILNLYR